MKVVLLSFNACLANHISWIVDIYLIISLSNLNHSDKYNNSGLTYAANNKRNDFCDALFCNGIDIEKCNRDDNGIKKYNDLIKRYKEAESKAQSNFDSARFKFEIAQDEAEKAEKQRKEINDYIQEINSERFNLKI
ncbi:hypothetical protein M9Y10_042827 [Tritrichomonas musculus]|uniref:Uncharacterized protein n=1 Tax=Tritrichomonas musculus TaxID=1915356 RepID=A0ABR2JXZ6_9EUKA